jgi:glyoxylase-like metal-dependent hydrolase (beta-lactamase superfamily II)
MTPLEDNAADILGKALRGLGLTPGTAAEKAGLPEDAVAALLDGGFDESDARALACALQLDAAALARIARGAYAPAVPAPANLAAVATAFGDMTVNAYVVWDADRRLGAIFDTGADAAPILELVRSENLDIVALFLTHSHADHIAALGELMRELEIEAWSSMDEPVPGTRNFRPGDYFNVGRHFIRTRLTPGHSPGGATFIVEGHTLQAAIVGDALFAGSIGGVRGDYPSTLATIRREILGLPDDTILCPGHGPMTTVALEKANNPFFA